MAEPDPYAGWTTAADPAPMKAMCCRPGLAEPPPIAAQPVRFCLAVVLHHPQAVSVRYADVDRDVARDAGDDGLGSSAREDRKRRLPVQPTG